MSSFQYRVALIGCPSRPDITWSRENLKRLADLGFNTVQLHIAWGARPLDEPLNLEDVVTLPESILKPLNRPKLPARSSSLPHDLARRKQDLQTRLALAQEMNFRTIFHFGAPFNSQYSGTVDMNGCQPQCLMDPNTTLYYQHLIKALEEQYPGIDDILVYTYDQDAWLCNEFGTCPSCEAIPLHERLVPFLDKLVSTWHEIRPSGYLWWSPWELSAAQVYHCVEKLSPRGLGLDLHPNIAETMVTHPVDRWLKNTCDLARKKNIPVLVESFLGAASEEVEPYQYLQSPLTSYQQVSTISRVPGVNGVKEYYGLIPTKEDPNLSASALAFEEPELDDESVLKRLAAPYAPVSDQIADFWQLCSEAQNLYPWELSWFMRGMGKSDISHALSAAFLRGQMCDTPSWCSSRSAIFMKTDSLQPHPWFLDDIQMRCQLSCDRYEKALEIGQEIQANIPAQFRTSFEMCLHETRDLRYRILTYTYHLRETNLVQLIRRHHQNGENIPSRLVEEFREVAQKDLANQQQYAAQIPQAFREANWIWTAEVEISPPPSWSRRFFRRDFTIDPANKIKQAYFCGTSSERSLRLSVNGQRIDEFGRSIPPFQRNLVELLRTGKNTLAIEVIKATSDINRPGLLASLELEYESGKKEQILTDGSWRSTLLFDSSWEQVETDTSTWMGTVERGKFGDPPWGTQATGDGGVELSKALDLFEQDLSAFLQTYFLEGPDTYSHGHFSVTSR